MSITINTNVNSLMVQHSLTTSTNNIGTSLERLSTGYRINKAADDAAGLTISQSFESQARGDQVASSNAQTGINLLQTAEGDMGVIQDNLQRIRDLTVQAANDTNGTSERNAIKSEVSQRLSEISRIAKASKFNSIDLLNGTYSSSNPLEIQIGSNSTTSLNAINICSSTTNPLASATATSLGIALTSACGNASAFSNYSGASGYIDKIDSAIATISDRRSTIGSYQNRLNSALDSLNVKYENMSASESQIRDTNVASESANLTKNQILQQASAQLLAQANASPQIALTLI
jgi:flagellin